MTIPKNLINVIAISVGENHALALIDDGTVIGWGNNRYNQISVPYNKDLSIAAISAGLNYSLAITNTGRVLGWGDNTFKRYTIPTTNDVLAIAASYANSVVSLRNGQMRVYGATQSNAFITRTPTINSLPPPTATPP
jgi:alpha-tubulin suppressor-like RCC1 family protein